jgi:MFS family permease
MQESNSRTKTGGPRLGPGISFAVTAGVIGLCLAAATTPSPLYELYQAMWRFSTVELTLVYAVYCFGVLAALLLFGRISDIWGRRPVIIAGLLALVVSMGLFLGASSVAWLFAARCIQGLATGIAISAAGAALLEWAPEGKSSRAGLINAVASSLGVGCGGLFGAALVQYVPSPLVVPFVVLAVSAILLLVTVAFVPETVVRRGGTPIRFARPHVPRQIRASFVVSGLGITTAWANVGLYQALVPTLAPALLRSHTDLAAGLAIFALGAASAAAPLLARALRTTMLIASGMVTLMMGVGVMALSLNFASSALFITASVVIGAGIGLGMVGSIRLVGEAAPAAHRASVMAAFYVVAYTAISVPAIIVGFVVRICGTVLSFQYFACAVVLLGLVALGMNTLVRRSAPTAGKTALPVGAEMD